MSWLEVQGVAQQGKGDRVQLLNWERSLGIDEATPTKLLLKLGKQRSSH